MLRLIPSRAAASFGEMSPRNRAAEQRTHANVRQFAVSPFWARDFEAQRCARRSLAARLFSMSRQDVLKVLRRETPKVRARFGVKRLALFGSVARDEARPDSDVDVLVEFDGPATLDRYMGLKFHLEDALGARVDLVTTTGLKSRVRPVVEREAIDVA